MNFYIKLILIFLGSLFGLYLLFLLIFLIHLNSLFESSSKAELIENYQDNSKEIKELHSYFNSIVPAGYIVYIEFKEENSIDFRVSQKDDAASFGWNRWFQAWNINPYDYKVDPKPSPPVPPLDTTPNTRNLSLVTHRLGWTTETFKQIKHYLDKANCISIENGEPSSIGFARSGMGKYFYAVFQSPIPDSLKATYNDSCRYLYFKPTVAFEYGGGAIGPQCFPD